jgi:hypothetical protein
VTGGQSGHTGATEQRATSPGGGVVVVVVVVVVISLAAGDNQSENYLRQTKEWAVFRIYPEDII